jgi:hypothetical protein
MNTFSTAAILNVRMEKSTFVTAEQVVHHFVKMAVFMACRRDYIMTKSSVLERMMSNTPDS